VNIIEYKYCHLQRHALIFFSLQTKKLRQLFIYACYALSRSALSRSALSRSALSRSALSRSALSRSALSRFSLSRFMLSRSALSCFALSRFARYMKGYYQGYREIIFNPLPSSDTVWKQKHLF